MARAATQEEDPGLVARARAGDGGAVEALVRRYLRPAYAVALGVLRNAADAEDVAHEALAAALQRLDQCREPARFSAWLLQGVRNRALHEVERGRVRTRHAAGEAPASSAPPAAARLAEREALLAALERLTPAQREVVLLHDLEGWTHGEIAAALGHSEVMCRQHLFVARKAMRAHLSAGAEEEAHHG